MARRRTCDGVALVVKERRRGLEAVLFQEGVEAGIAAPAGGIGAGEAGRFAGGRVGLGVRRRLGKGLVEALEFGLEEGVLAPVVEGLGINAEVAGDGAGGVAEEEAGGGEVARGEGGVTG